MITPLRALVSLAVVVAVVAGAAPPRAIARSQSPAQPPLARIIWLEDVGAPSDREDQPAACRPIEANDARLRDYERWIETEAGRFARRLVYTATQRFGTDPIYREPVFPVLIRKGGNNPGFGLTITTPRGVEAHPQLPFVILDPSPEYLGDTVLHETAHLVQSLAQRKILAPTTPIAPSEAPSRWSAFPHTTFATSDPLTAVSEGYGIQFETLWGHFGVEPGKQAYYRRLSPSFAAGNWKSAEYFAPVVDLMNFAQVWSRYEAVRDGLPAFEGHVYPGAWPRTQMDPSRDRARLKNPNAMLASEGVAASVFFWTSAALAEERGAKPGGGLDQPGIAEAQMAFLEAFAMLPAQDTAAFRPDLLDVVQALGRANRHAGEVAIARLVDITRGVTARPAIADTWRTLYDDAIMLDLTAAKAAVTTLDAERSAIVARAREDATTLRAGVGPVIPVQVKGGTFEMKAFGHALPLQLDLNAMGEAELALLPALDAAGRRRVLAERTRSPFASAPDFASRCGVTLAQIGLALVDRTPRAGTR